MKIKNLLTGILVLIAFITYAQNKDIDITYDEKSDNSIDFHYTKNVPGSYSVRVEFNRLDNSNGSRVHEQVIKYGSGNLFTLRPYNKERGISFSYSVRYILGNPHPKVDDKILYALPFKTGKTVTIREATHLGEEYFGSEKPVDWKSFIVNTNEADTIYSMRRGIVVKIVDNYNSDDKFKKTFTSKRNWIVIEHKDGTYASYEGLDKNQIFVKLGQEVYPHTPLGKLGKFNKDDYRFDFSVYHYTDGLLDDQEKNTLRDRKYRTKYLNPNFFIDGSDKKIKPGESYKVLFNDDIKLQEFSRREKRKYKKNPSNFQ